MSPYRRRVDAALMTRLEELSKRLPATVVSRELMGADDEVDEFFVLAVVGEAVRVLRVQGKPETCQVWVH